MSIVAIAGSAFTYYLPGLEDQANPGLFKAAPTIAAGDFTISVNGGAFEALDNTPTVSPAGGTQIAIVLSATETTAAGAGGRITVNCQDAAGAEWYSVGLAIPVQAADVSTLGGTAQTGDAYARLTGTVEPAIADVPTVAEFNARTLPTASYFDPATDTVTPSGGSINSVSGSVNSVATGVTLADDAITSAKFDESTAFPIKLADTGSTKIARVGADSDTLETLSDQLDAIRLVTDAIDASAVTVTSSNDAGVLTITRGVTFTATVSGLTISATWAKLYFTLKESDYDDDDAAIVQIVESNPGVGADGLLYLDGAAIVTPITAADGTLTVNQAGGTVAIAITDNATVQLTKASGLVWDIKTKDAAGATVQNATGTASILRSITQTI